uniref:Uncharacterized protein n=1 Tax=viral metagenome TaxID=1070528 RepID=A0A6C0JKD9_9ZZZZ
MSSRRNPLGTPSIFAVNFPSYRSRAVDRPGTRYRGTRPQGPLIEAPVMNLPQHMFRRFERLRVPYQRGEPVMNRNVATGTLVSGNSLNNGLPRANPLRASASVRETPHPSTLAINHLVSLNRDTLRYVTKRGRLVNPYGILFEDLERDFDEVAEELTGILTKLHIEPDELDRARYLLQLMSEFDRERTNIVKENIERILSEKRGRQMANKIRARPRTLRNRGRSLGRRITRGIQRRLGTRASRNSNSNNE